MRAMERHAITAESERANGSPPAATLRPFGATRRQNHQYRGARNRRRGAYASKTSNRASFTTPPSRRRDASAHR